MSVRTAQKWLWFTGILLLVFISAVANWFYAHRVPAAPTIAFIPRTAGAMLSDVERFGATVAAAKVKCHLYWTAPTSESDAAGQISLIDNVARGKYQGLVLDPTHSLSILSALRRALAAGLPVVVVSAPLEIPPNDKLGYIINDDEKMGELAAAETARRIDGKGPIALVGLARYSPGMLKRILSAERFLASRFPEIQVVSRLPGAYDASRAEELTSGALDTHPGIKAVLSFTATSTRGAHAALKGRGLQRDISLVGCEQDADLLGYVETGEIAAILAENTYRMGHEAVELVAAAWAGKPIPAQSVVEPMLITRQNLASPQASPFIRVSR